MVVWFTDLDATTFLCTIKKIGQGQCTQLVTSKFILNYLNLNGCNVVFGQVNVIEYENVYVIVFWVNGIELVIFFCP